MSLLGGQLQRRKLATVQSKTRNRTESPVSMSPAEQRSQFTDFATILSASLEVAAGKVCLELIRQAFSEISVPARTSRT